LFFKDIINGLLEYFIHLYIYWNIIYILLGSGEPEPWAVKKQVLELKEIELEEQKPLNATTTISADNK
jgi:hypothetical protein